jgi:hypothetical protein
MLGDSHFPVRTLMSFKSILKIKTYGILNGDTYYENLTDEIDPMRTWKGIKKSVLLFC